MATKRPSLGRGLGALLGQPQAVSAPVSTTPTMDVVRDHVLATLPVDLLQRGKYQPRVDMRPESLQELADSIRMQGVVQPIVVRPLTQATDGPKRYEIIAGERRWRAAQMAGLHEVPAVVRLIPDEAAVAIALIENIQRENLNPIEEARALERLIKEFELTHQAAAEAVGRSRAAVSNLLRLLELASEVKTLLEQGQLEMGHARALLSLSHAQQQAVAAAQVVAQGLSVRQTEALVRRLATESDGAEVKKSKPDPNVRQLEGQLAEKLGATVQIQHTAGGKGKLVIHYHGLDALEGILARIR